MYACVYQRSGPNFKKTTQNSTAPVRRPLPVVQDVLERERTLHINKHEGEFVLPAFAELWNSVTHSFLQADTEEPYQVPA